MYVDDCVVLQKKDADIWKLSGDTAVALSSSVVATKMSAGAGDTQLQNGLATPQDSSSSAFRPPADPLAADTTSLYSSHGKIAALATDVDDSMSSSDRRLVNKSQKRSRSPSGIDVTTEAQSKFLRISASQRLFGSMSSLTTADGYSRAGESVYHDSKQEFSSDDNRGAFPNHACSLIPLCHEYQMSAAADGLRNVPWLPREDVPVASSIAAANDTSQPCVISPVAASPYLPFLTSTPASNISSLYYPNPYIMLSPPPLAYQQTPHFPCGWISSAIGTGPTASKLAAEHMLDSQAQLHRAPMMSAAAAFDFPWMRGNPADERHLVSASSKQSYGFDMQHVLTRDVSAAAGVGSALLSDGLDVYRQPSCALPSIANRVLLDNQHTPYLGIYPSLFHPSYLGIPSR